MVQEPLFEYVGMHLTGYTVVNGPNDNDNEDIPEEPELVLLDTELE